MKLIACLGNPGKKYQKTRHNVGFMAGEKIADEFSISVKQKNFSALFGKGKINNEDTAIIFPQTFMNNSGESIAQAMNFFKLSPEDLIVIHDEIELPFGDIRKKLAGGHKGHNGLRSIIAKIQSPDFHRIRIGVGRPENSNIPVADYVLSNFEKDELLALNEKYQKIKDILLSIF